MKMIACLTALAVLVFGFGGSALAATGGTKYLVAMRQAEKGEAQFGPLLVLPREQMTPSKPFVKFLQRIPQPTLSTASLREERRPRSLGTKPIVGFWKKG